MTSDTTLWGTYSACSLAPSGPGPSWGDFSHSRKPILQGPRRFHPGLAHGKTLVWAGGLWTAGSPWKGTWPEQASLHGDRMFFLGVVGKKPGAGIQLAS